MQFLVLALNLLLLAALVISLYWLYQGWLWIYAVLIPFVDQWWWLSLAAATVLGYSQAVSLMRESIFHGFAGNLPVVPKDIEQVASSAVIKELADQLKELEMRKQNLLRSRAGFQGDRTVSARDVRFTKSGRANNRSRAGRTYNKEEATSESFNRELRGIDEKIIGIHSGPENRINLRVLEWRSHWRTFGSLDGLREGSIFGGAFALTGYILFNWHLPQAPILASIGSTLIYAIIIFAFTRNRAEKFEKLADKEIDRACQDGAARNEKPIYLGLAPALPPSPRQEA